MKISTKTLIVVLVCLLGALLAATSILASYQSREDARKNNELSVLALRDVAHLETALSQWFTTIDLFFNAQQAYLASGIAKQSTQLQNIVDLIQLQLAPQLDDKLIFTVLDDNVRDISTMVMAASLSQGAAGVEWNTLINRVDDKSIAVVTSVELMTEWAEAKATTTASKFKQRELWFKIITQISLLNYLFVLFVVWRWANSNIVSPIEKLIAQTSAAEQLIERVDEQSFNFKLREGPLEIRLLSDGLQRFIDSLQESRQRVQRRNQTIEQQTLELQVQMEALKETRMQLVQSEKMASVGQLAAGVAHEINNPVGFISSNLTTLQEYIVDIEKLIVKQKQCIEQFADQGNNSDQANTAIGELLAMQEKLGLDDMLADLNDLVDESIDGAGRVKKIVDDLSDFTHVNATSTVSENINDLLDRTLTLASNEIKTGTQIVKEYGDIKPVIADGGKLGQLFFSLVSNAGYAVEGNGEIILRTAMIDNNKVRVDIIDNGCGIPEAKLATIFDPFYTTKDVGKGTGLGLHIAQSIAETHGGKIKASSEVDVGTMLTVILPIKGKDACPEDVVTTPQAV